MNKYIVRTSLVWLGVVAVVAGLFYYRSPAQLVCTIT